MERNRKYRWILLILIMVAAILTYKLVIIQNKSSKIKNQVSLSNTAEKVVIEKYGYSDILQSLSKNSSFKVETINMVDNDKCTVEVIYSGDIKLLYNSLYSLMESENFIGINRISTNNHEKITNISIDFIKNK